MTEPHGPQPRRPALVPALTRVWRGPDRLQLGVGTRAPVVLAGIDPRRRAVPPRPRRAQRPGRRRGPGRRPRAPVRACRAAADPPRRPPAASPTAPADARSLASLDAPTATGSHPTWPPCPCCRRLAAAVWRPSRGGAPRASRSAGRAGSALRWPPCSRPPASAPSPWSTTRAVRPEDLAPARAALWVQSAGRGPTPP